MKRLKHILCKVLEIGEDEIYDRLTPRDVTTWDSMNALILVSELERTFDVRFTFAEVTGVQCVGDIKDVLRKHGVVLHEDGLPESKLS